MSVVGSQQQTYLRLVRALQPHWHRDVAFPARIQALFSRHKEFGSRDRRLYRELIYTTLRYLPWIEPLLESEPERAIKIVAWLAAPTREMTAFRTETAGDWPTVDKVTDRASFLGVDPIAVLPGWFRTECPAVFEGTELDFQVRRAPVWLRLQTDKAESVAAEFQSKGWTWRTSDVLGTAWQLLVEADVTKSDGFARGMVEVQDLGSQLLLESIGIEPGGAWLDACAGAGGKTLQLGRLLGPTGTVAAFDIRPAALDELCTRVARAGLTNVRTIAAPVDREYDGVLIDAPCSGSGTWRRSPHLKWTTPAATIAQKAALQVGLLEQAAPRVRRGGRLVYATCSLARSENVAVVTTFLERHPEFSPAPFANTFGYEPRPEGLTVMPSRHDTDGFFVASLIRQNSSPA